VSNFTASFGAVDPDSRAGQAQLGRKSAGEAEVVQAGRLALQKKLGALETKDDLTSKAATRLKVDVTAFRCRECGYLSQSRSSLCEREGHDVRRLQAVKRFFECGGCKGRISLLNQRLPETACAKCGGKFHSCSVTREKLAAAPSDEFLARGIEHGRFLGADGPRAGAAGEGREAGGGAAQHHRRAVVDAGRANAFAAQVPLHDGPDD